MTRSFTIFVCQTILVFLLRTSNAQEVPQLGQALIDRIATEYIDETVKRINDSQAVFNARDIAKNLDETRKDLSDQGLSNDEYWEQVELTIKDSIRNSDSEDDKKPKIQAFFEGQVRLLKAQGKQQRNDNDALVLLISGLGKVGGKLYDWRSRVTGTVGAVAGSSTPTNANAGVPGWYKAMTEHKKWCWENRVKKHAWYRAAHGY